MRYFFAILITSVVLFSCSKSTDVPYTEDDPVSLSNFQKEMLNAVNEIREKGCMCGNEKMPPVAKITWNEKLAKASQIHSDYMAANKTMTHTWQDGKTAPQRVLEQGYTYRFVAENVAYNQRSVNEVIIAWLKSPGHCVNIMSANVTEMGAAVNSWYWTQVFASPR